MAGFARLKTTAGFAAIFLVFLLWFFMRSSSNPESSTSSYQHATVSIQGHDFTADVSDTPALRAQGLSGRELLEPNQAMLFKFDEPVWPTFWMKDMRFPIDIIWIREGTIIGTVKSALPEPGVSTERLKRYYAPDPIDFVLEVRAGTADEFQFQPGQSVQILLP